MDGGEGTPGSGRGAKYVALTAVGAVLGALAVVDLLGLYLGYSLTPVWWSYLVFGGIAAAALTAARKGAIRRSPRRRRRRR